MVLRDVNTTISTGRTIATQQAMSIARRTASSARTTSTPLFDDLASTNPAGPGASLVGAEAVAGTPNALPPGHVGSQLAQLLTWINDHLNVSSGAHNASAVAASAHNYISGANVQAQLQEIVDDIESSSSWCRGRIPCGRGCRTGPRITGSKRNILGASVARC